MKKYKLLKDLPFAKAGAMMEMWSDGTMAFVNNPALPRFNKKDVRMFSLWFEEIKEPSEYYLITDDGYIDYTLADGHKTTMRRKAIGNCFETREEAEKYREYLKAKAIIKQDTKGFKPDWKDIAEDKYYGFWDASAKKLDWIRISILQDDRIYFETKNDIKESFEKHPDEWKTYLTYEK